MTSLVQYPKARRDESIVEDHHGTKVGLILFLSCNVTVWFVFDRATCFVANHMA